MHSRRLVSIVACGALASFLVSACGSGNSVTSTPSAAASSPVGSQASTAELSIFDVDPLLGPITGGTALTITGQGFTGSPQVTIGSAAATDIVVVSDTTITAVTPPGEAGPVDVTVSTSALQPTTWDGVFTYIGRAPAPTITKASGVRGGVIVEFTDDFTIADAIENYEYSVDGGATWTAFDPPQAKVPSLTIEGLTAGTSYDVAIRGLNIAGPGASSNAVAATAK